LGWIFAQPFSLARVPCFDLVELPSHKIQQV
jgi:hypothetical protein